MSYIIGNKCISECDTACVKVCPVDCINGPITIDGLGKEVKTMGKDGIFGLQLYINPGECIDWVHVNPNVLLMLFLLQKS